VDGALEDVIAPPPGELFSETNDNSVAILLTYGTARVLLAGDVQTREEESEASNSIGHCDRSSDATGMRGAPLVLRARSYQKEQGRKPILRVVVVDGHPVMREGQRPY